MREMVKKPTLWIVVPCYNEQEVLPLTFPVFMQELADMTAQGLISQESRILYVNDGSTDQTWRLIRTFASEDARCLGVSLSRNRGHQNALLCGLMEARSHCDIAVSMDCDGQDDIHVISRMVAAYTNGAEIVYGVRKSRETDTFFKRFTARAYYKVLKALGADVVSDHADYRLLSRRVLEELAAYGEVNLFLRGMIPLIGFTSAVVEYDRCGRISGKTHYPLSKMLALAADGITSLSIKPLRLIVLLGFAVSFFSFVGVVWAIVSALCGKTVSGWASTTCIICFVSGVQLLALGVIGEYVGKTYLETKSRPRFIVSQRTWDNDTEDESHTC